MKRKTILKRQMHRDGWNLDLAFLSWLLPRLEIYLKDADKMIDLTFHKFEYNGKEYTQKELVQKMITNLQAVRDEDAWDPHYCELVDEVLTIWKLVFHSMWW